MRECRFVQRTLEETNLADLVDEFRLPLIAHLAECPDCRLAFERGNLLSESVYLAEPDAPARASAGRGSWKFGVARPLKFACLSLSGCACRPAAAWYGAPIISAWRYPGEQVSPVREAYRLVGLPAAPLSQSDVGPGHIGPWRVDGDDAGGFASLDSSVRHLGHPTIKLLQRNGSGHLTELVKLPLPANSLITIGTWVYSPRGGTPDNKYFRMSVSVPDTYNSSSTDILDASPNWRPEILSSFVAKPISEFNVELGTSNGFGHYDGWDWATWVSDIYVGVNIFLGGTFRDVGDKQVIAEVERPQGYESASVSLDVGDNNVSTGGIPAKLLSVERGANDRAFRVVIDSPEVEKEFASTTGHVAVYTIHGRFQLKGFSVPFEVGLVGPGSEHPKRFGPKLEGVVPQKP